MEYLYGCWNCNGVDSLIAWAEMEREEWIKDSLDVVDPIGYKESAKDKKAE